MLSWSSYTHPSPPLLLVHHQKPLCSSCTAKSHSPVLSLHTGLQEISQIAQNKVLVAATLSSAIGQFSKPFTSVLFYSDNLHFRSLSRAGGFPSVHTAGVVAAATSLGLERGLSDSIFGMSVIFAAIVMYDAQAVRWEVGKHAKLLNKTILLKAQNQQHTEVNSNLQTSILENSEAENPPLYLKSDNLSGTVPSSLSNNGDPVLRGNNNNLVPLEESIGHTQVEVVGGAFLGFLTSLVVYSVM